MAEQPPVPIAIIGMGCRFPSANSPEKLWQMVLTGQSAWRDVPADRYNAKSFYHPNPDAAGAHNSRGGHFLDQDLAEFDANFFGIPAAEADAIDPQQRLHLETAYEALENAGIPLETVRGSNTSVYVAVVSRDYDRMIYKDPIDIPKYHLTGCGDATACGRISYFFDFRGPSMTIDTGCSGSMVGLHQACQSLRLRESTMALVGGTNLLLGPDMTIAMSMLHMLNDDGRCYSFDSRGSGYGRSEGVATVILKRLDDALMAGDPIRAVIRNSGVNQDGKTNGILLPSLISQENLIRSMFQSVNLDPNEVGYVEAHGTGTIAGDMTELGSISNAFCNEGRKTPLYVGSIKANIGHAESCSGLAGVIKACLAIEHGLIPPVPNVLNLKEGLQLESGIIKIPQKIERWPTSGIRRACVNSFGFGGTNSHIILESAPGSKKMPNGHTNGIPKSIGVNGTNGIHGTDKIINDNRKAPQLFVITAKSKPSLITSVNKYREWLREHKTTSLGDLAYTLASRRTLLSCRVAVVAFDIESIIFALQAPRVAKASSNPQASFLFTGQGAQWFGMARELIPTPIFGQSLLRSENILRTLGSSWDLIAELQKPEINSIINQSEISQPTTTAIQIALVDLLQSFSITPKAVLGHSSGEIAAAYAANILTHETALKISYHRAFISSWCREDVKGKGAMLAVGLGEDDVLPYISSLQKGIVSVACVNSPASTTISGDEVAIKELKRVLDGNSIFNRILKVDTAYHSEHMKVVANRYLRSLDVIKAASPNHTVKFFSSVTGEEKKSEFGASYWVENLISKVRFSDALRNLVASQSLTKAPMQLFIELGPHSALQGPVRQTLSHLNPDLTKHVYLPSLVRDKDARVTILDLAGQLFEQGYAVNLCEANSLADKPSAPRKVIHDLPAYSWTRERHWHESRLSREYRFREHPNHDLLGLRVIGGNLLEPTWRHVLSVDSLPWLQEHIIDNFALFPGSGFLCMAIEGMRQIIHDRKISGNIKRFVMRDIAFSKALVIPDAPGKIEVQLSFRKPNSSESAWEEFCVTALTQDGKTWNEHCRGFIMAEFVPQPNASDHSHDNELAEVEAQEEERLAIDNEREQLMFMQKSCTQDIEFESLYHELRSNGIDYGETFASIKKLRIGPCQAVGTVIIPDVAKCMPSNFMQPHIIHPATFDALMHIVLPLYSRHCSSGPAMLTSIKEVTVSATIFNKPEQELLVACSLSPAGKRSGTVDVSVFQGAGLDPALTLTREEFRGLGESKSKSQESLNARMGGCHLEWTEEPTSAQRDNALKPDINIVHEPAFGSQRSLANAFSHAFKTIEFKATLVSWASMSIKHDEVYLVIDDSSEPMLTDPLPERFEQIKRLFLETDLVIWINIHNNRATTDPEKDLVKGLARALRQKNKNLRLVTLDIRSDAEDLSPLIRSLLTVIVSFQESKEESLIDHEYFYNNGKLYVPRYVPNDSFDAFCAATIDKEATEMALFHQSSQPLKLVVETPGILESMIFVSDDPPSISLLPGEIEIRLQAHGINQHDVSVAVGRSNSPMIGECAGVITSIGSKVPSKFQLGDRVCGWGATSSYGSSIRIDYNLVQRLPSSLSFVQGAAIPYAFEAAYLGLIEIANLQKGQKVLIHSAAGGVGQAAIMLAKHIGAQIFATVSTPYKRQLLVDNFEIPEGNIFSSQSKTFKKAILRLTGGRGVDVVLSSLGQGEALHETWACMAKFGTFINLGSCSGQLSMTQFINNVTFASINMALLAQHQPERVGGLLDKVLAMFEAGSLRHIDPITAMPITEITDAFRIIQCRKNSGKFVLTADESTVVKQKKMKLSSLRLDGAGTYLIAAAGDISMASDICLFMALHGAKHILTLVESHEQAAALRASIKSMAGTVEVVLCDITHRRRVKAALSGIKNIKGVVQLNMFLEDQSRSKMGVNDYHLAVHTQTDGTRFLAEALNRFSLDFFLMLSTLADALGPGSTPGHAAGSAFQRAFAACHDDSKTHYMSLSIGTLDKFATKVPRISLHEFHSLLEYSIGGTAKQDKCHQLLVGLDRQAISLYEPALLGDPIFSKLTQVSSTEAAQEADSTKSIGQTLVAAKSQDEVQAIIGTALVEQISSLVALDIDDITLDLPVTEIGLDSLIAIEFKNWIGRNFSAAMQTSEILDATNLQALATLIASRSTFVSHGLPIKTLEIEKLELDVPTLKNSTTPQASNRVQKPINAQESSGSVVPQTTKLPRHPLPDLESTLQLYLTSIRSFCSPKELEHTRAVIEDFQKPGGLGRKLQDRLLERFNNPKVENWVFELYLASGFLERRVQLVPFSSFFFGHQHSLVPHSQATRATVISLAAFEFKQLLDAGKVECEILNEQPTCMHLHQWLFNSNRKPCISADVMEKFPGNDYLIALRKGRVFKVMLSDGSSNISFEDLNGTFEAILDLVDGDVSWVGILTNDERNSWAKMRDTIIEVNEANEKYIHVIEAAVFVVCLDTASPKTSVERAAHFHFGDGSNRWNDKSIQFLVCENGFSGFAGEHTMLDAGTVHGLNAAVNKAIVSYRPAEKVNGHSHAILQEVKFEEFSFTMTPAIEAQISRVREQFIKNVTGIEHAFFTYSVFGGAFLRGHKAAPKSAFQLIVLLAAQDLFGYIPPLWETVSVSNFHQGRIDVNQIVLPPVADFCAIARNESVPVSVRRKLFLEAIKAHSNSVIRASRGRGVDRHLSALRQVPKEDEPLPDFYKDSTYNKTRPRKIMAHCHETGMLEKGFVLRDPEAIWVHYELDDYEVRFAVTGTTGKTNAFCELVKKNAGLVRELLLEE